MELAEQLVELADVAADVAGRTELAQTELVRTELVQTELAQTELAQTELAQMELAQTELVQMELAQTELVRTELVAGLEARAEMRQLEELEVLLVTVCCWDSLKS